MGEPNETHSRSSSGLKSLPSRESSSLAEVKESSLPEKNKRVDPEKGVSRSEATSEPNAASPPVADLLEQASMVIRQQRQENVLLRKELKELKHHLARMLKLYDSGAPLKQAPLLEYLNNHASTIKALCGGETTTPQPPVGGFEASRVETSKADSTSQPPPLQCTSPPPPEKISRKNQSFSGRQSKTSSTSYANRHSPFTLGSTAISPKATKADATKNSEEKQDTGLVKVARSEKTLPSKTTNAAVQKAVESTPRVAAASSTDREDDLVLPAGECPAVAPRNETEAQMVARLKRAIAPPPSKTQIAVVVDAMIGELRKEIKSKLENNTLQWGPGSKCCEASPSSPSSPWTIRIEKENLCAYRFIMGREESVRYVLEQRKKIPGCTVDGLLLENQRKRDAGKRVAKLELKHFLVHLTIDSGRLTVLTGGGHLDLLEFLERKVHLRL